MFIEGEPKQEPSELIGNNVRDANGDVCAGLIILSDLKGLKFQSADGIVKIDDSNPGRSLLFLSPNERVIDVYCVGYTPLQIILSEENIRLKSGQTWSVKVTSTISAG